MSKEATVVCLDVGRNMWEGHPDRLDQARLAVMQFLQQKVMDGKKTEHVGLVVFGSEETKNDLAADQDYQNIKVVQGLEMPTLDMIRFVDSEVGKSRNTADFLDALIVAMDMIVSHTEGKKFFRRIILVSDVGAPSSPDVLEKIVDQLNAKEIALQIFGVDFADPDSSAPPPERSATKIANEAVIARMSSSLPLLQVIPMSDALERLSFFRARNVRQTPLYRGALDIAGSDANGLQISVHVYTKTAEAKAPTFKRTLVDDEHNIHAIQRDLSYKRTDELGAEVDKEQLVKAYKYGKSLIPFARVDEEQLAVHYDKCLSVIGITSSANVPQHAMLGNALQVEAEPGNTQAAVALSAFIHALHELDRVAIVRYIRMNAKYGPKLCVLSPHIRVGYECLFMTSLPFSDDMRMYGFASLAKRAPSQSQLDATDAFIDAMDLCTASRDSEGSAVEDLKPSSVPNIHVHHVQEIIKFRALNPTRPLPALHPTLKRLTEPNPALISGARDAREAFQSSFSLTKSVQAEKRTVIRAWQAPTDGFETDGNRPEEDVKRPRVDFDGMSMRALADGAVSTIGTADPVGDFTKMMSRRDADLIGTAIDQMIKIIGDLITRSFGAQNYDRAVECVVALRAGCIVESEASKFNAFLVESRDLYKGGGRDEFWQRIKGRNLSLISVAEAADSDVGVEEAQRFLAGDHVDVKVEAVAPKETDDADDLLAEMD